MTIKAAMVTYAYESIRSLWGNMPPAAARITDPMVGSSAGSMTRSDRASHEQPGAPPGGAERPEAVRPASVARSSYPLYMARATHDRRLRMGSDMPMRSTFTAKLPLVRVPLPSKVSPDDLDPAIETPFGTVYLRSDHKMRSVEHIARKYAGPDHLGYEPARVDLITPTRECNVRFGAIAVYLGYRHESDTSPSFYFLEAGTATGESKMLFFGKTMDTQIEQRSWYVPTPFASDKNRYRGRLRVEGDEPSALTIEAFEPGREEPYMEISVHFERVASTDRGWPLMARLMAVARVALIGDAMKAPMGRLLDLLKPLLVPIARRFKWIHMPRPSAERALAEPGPTPTAHAFPPSSARSSAASE